jgi:hypothetical protein
MVESQPNWVPYNTPITEFTITKWCLVSYISTSVIAKRKLDKAVVKIYKLKR